MRRVLISLSGLLVIAYPFVVFIGLRSFSMQVLGFALVVLALGRILLGQQRSNDNILPLLLSLVLLLVAAYALLANNPESFLYYPVAVNAVLLGVFGYSLLHGPTFVERLARLTETQLSTPAVIYTRKVTWVWCVFFVANGCAALYTAQFTTREIWALYNGLIAYLLMGMIFAVEFLIRCSVKRAENVGAG